MEKYRIHLEKCVLKSTFLHVTLFSDGDGDGELKGGKYISTQSVLSAFQANAECECTTFHSKEKAAFESKDPIYKQRRC